MRKLQELTRRLRVTTGILCVPAAQIQQTAETMIDSGIKAIWNFSPFDPEVPRGIVIENIELTASFALLVSKNGERKR